MGATRNAIAAASSVFALLGGPALAGCARERASVPDTCFGTPASTMSTLREVPPVLDDGTRLSECVSAARTDGDLQSLGLLFVRVADVLRTEAGADPDAAFALGYLSGAVTRGAAASSGSIAAQLARRVDQVATLDPGASAASVSALARGRRAGTREG